MTKNTTSLLRSVSTLWKTPGEQSFGVSVLVYLWKGITPGVRFPNKPQILLCQTKIGNTMKNLGTFQAFMFISGSIIFGIGLDNGNSQSIITGLVLMSVATILLFVNFEKEVE